MTTNVDSPAPVTTEPAPKPRLPFVVCVLIAIVLMFANYVIIMPLQAVANALGMPQEGAVSMAFNIVGCFVVLGTAIALTYLLARYVLGRSLRDIGFLWSKDSWWLALVGFGVSFAAVTLARLLVPLTGIVHNQPVPWEQVTPSVVLWSVAVKTAQAIALQGIPEELDWRGWLMHALVERPRTALVVSAVAFGAMHFVSKGNDANPLVYMLTAAAFAFCAGALALRLRSLWPAIGVHAGMHMTNLIHQFLGLNASGTWIWLFQTAVWVGVGLAALAGWKGTRVSYTR